MWLPRHSRIGFWTKSQSACHVRPEAVIIIFIINLVSPYVQSYWVGQPEMSYLICYRFYSFLSLALTRTDDARLYCKQITEKLNR